MSPADARKALHDLGARTEEWCSSFSHYLRVWYPADAPRPLVSMDFTNSGGLPKRKVDRLITRITSIKNRSTK